MNGRAFLLGLALGVTFAAVPSCGPTQKRCLRSNCNGCCDANNDCQPGSLPGACGTEGRTCAVCMAGVACTAGVCQGTGGGGGSAGGSSGGGGTGGASAGGMAACANCNGCCENGACRGGNTFTACGRGGAVCENCQAQNKACNASGQCIAFACPGCLSDAGVCTPGNSNLACGGDGGVCQQCASNQTCFNGSCMNATTCGPANCSGCCDGTTCVQNPNSSKCGSSGNACIACNGTETCQSGTCVGATSGGVAGGGGTGGGIPLGGGLALPCSPINCSSGCCDTAGTCQPGSANDNCGNLGLSCRNCSSFCVPGLKVCF